MLQQFLMLLITFGKQKIGLLVYVSIDSTDVSAPGCSQAGKKYKQVQPQVEVMLKSKFIEMISHEQFIFLGFKHDCSRLLHCDDVRDVEGYHRNGNYNFIWDDITLSKGSKIKEVEEELQVRTSHEVETLKLKFHKNNCAGVKKCE